jgi:hypothetical protein
MTLIQMQQKQKIQGKKTRRCGLGSRAATFKRLHKELTCRRLMHRPGNTIVVHRRFGCSRRQQQNVAVTGGSTHRNPPPRHASCLHTLGRHFHSTTALGTSRHPYRTEGIVLCGYSLLHVFAVLCVDKGTAAKNWDEGGGGVSGKKYKFSLLEIIDN